MATEEEAAIDRAFRELNPDLARAMKNAEYASTPYFSANEIKDGFTAGYRAHAAQGEARVRELEACLRQIAQWDAINPPPNDGSDLPWLKRLVAGALPSPPDPTRG